VARHTHGSPSLGKCRKTASAAAPGCASRVHVGVRQMQTCRSAGRSGPARRWVHAVDADGDCNVDFGVGKQPVALDFQVLSTLPRSVQAPSGFPLCPS
jgi:hypothetical protein